MFQQACSMTDILSDLQAQLKELQQFKDEAAAGIVSA
jgi:adenylate cyclase